MTGKKWCVGWGPIKSCNMKCTFCYSKNIRSHDEELSASSWFHFIDENSNLIESINYGTGENSMSAHWFSLIEHVKEIDDGIAQAVTTNGYLSAAVKNHKDHERIILNSLSEIDVSLDFFDAADHNAFRGQVNAYNWVMDTLGMFKDSGIALTIVMIGINQTLTPRNLDGLMEICDRYDAKLRINLFRPTEGIDDKSKVFVADFEKIITAIKYMSSHYRIISISDPLFSSILLSDVNDRETDPSGSNSIRILSDGSITPSTYLLSKNFRKYNIRESKVLQKLNNADIWIPRDLPASCATCPLARTCGGGAFDRRYLWYHDFSHRDPYCPFREENFEPDFQVSLSKELTFSSIHHGYLPTMFFMP